MKQKRMLYLMHIDWNWIKQRPQYIEECLEDNYVVTVFCPRNYRLKEYNDKKNMRVFYSIPFIRRFRCLWKIDEFRKSRIVRRLIKGIKPEYIYSTHPEFGRMIPCSYGGVVIYDCMDDMLAFQSKKSYVERAEKQENSMVERADIVLASSERLKSVLAQRYPDSSHKLELVRNGYGGEIVQVSQKSKEQKFTLCYFGTISHWFDFEFIMRSLDDFPDLMYKLIGPIETGTSIPKHERLIYIPPVKHEELEKETEMVDGFIMPFKINDLILSVDPVKLYEYINFGKDILCVEYPEIKRFESFVYFYNTYEEFYQQIEKMKMAQDRKYTNEERILFLSKNDWKHRAETIMTLVNNHEVTK